MPSLKADLPSGAKRRPRPRIAIERLSMDASEFSATLGIGESTFFKYRSSGLIGPEPSALGFYSVEEVKSWVLHSQPNAEKWRAMRSAALGLRTAAAGERGRA